MVKLTAKKAAMEREQRRARGTDNPFTP